VLHIEVWICVTYRGMDMCYIHPENKIPLIIKN